MEISRTNQSCSVVKPVASTTQTKKIPKKVVKKKHAVPKKGLRAGTIAKKVAAPGSRVASKAEGKSESKLFVGELKEGAEAKELPLKKARVIVRDYRAHTRKKLSKEFSEIVDGMLTAAKAGKLTDTKLKMLLDLAGVHDDPLDESKRKGAPSLGKLLLEEANRRRQAALDALKSSLGESVPAEGAVLAAV